MRKIILWMSVSLDGYLEGPDRDIGWHVVDDELHAYFNDHLRTMGAFLSGRVTYELMEEFWPNADADPANRGPMAEIERLKAEPGGSRSGSSRPTPSATASCSCGTSARCRRAAHHVSRSRP